MNLGALFHKFPIDKQAHFCAGAAISLAIGSIYPFAGLLAAVIAGIFKELYDKFSKTGTPDVYDFIATATGGLAGVLWTTAVSYLK